MQDNYGHRNERAGALYRYEYATDKVTELEYKYLYTNKFKICDCSDDFISYIPFTVENDYYDVIGNGWFESSYHFGDYIIFIDANTDMVKYDASHKKNSRYFQSVLS